MADISPSARLKMAAKINAYWDAHPNASSKEIHLKTGITLDVIYRVRDRRLAQGKVASQERVKPMFDFVPAE